MVKSSILLANSELPLAKILNYRGTGVTLVRLNDTRRRGGSRTARNAENSKARIAITMRIK